MASRFDVQSTKQGSKSINQVQRKLIPEEPESDSISDSAKRRKTDISASVKVGNGDDQQHKSFKKFHVSCLTKWYRDEDCDKACPICSNACNCKACLSVSSSPEDINGYSRSVHDKIRYSKHILQNVFPLVLGEEQLLEKKMPLNSLANMLTKAESIYKSYNNISPTCDKCCICDGNELSPKNIKADDMNHFQFHWAKGEPVIVNDVVPISSGLSWEPMVMWRAFHQIKKSSDNSHTHSHAYEVKAVNCLDGSDVKIDLYKFFRGYLEDCPVYLKLEEWKPSGLCEQKWPQHFIQFLKLLPFKDYTHPYDGYLNLVNKLPDLSLKPDTGPKMDICYPYSVTKLHCDKSDTVNVLTHTSSTKQRNDDEQDLDDTAALWDIFRKQDIPKLQEYVKKYSCMQVSDPIHDRSFYIDTENKMKLKQEYGIEPLIIKQKLGDAIFIPAGYPYQVTNLKSNTKVEVNFISPESLGECIRLQQEFRMLPDNHRTKRDKLNIQNMMIYALHNALTDLDLDANNKNGWISESESDSDEDSSKIGVWQDHDVGPEVKKLLEEVEQCYPSTFRGIDMRSEEIWMPILKAFHLAIKRFMVTKVDTLTEDHVTSLHEDLKEFERFGFDLSWAHERLNMLDMLEKGRRLEKSVKEKLVKKTVEFVEASKKLIQAELEYNNAKDARDNMAREVANNFGDDYERVLNGNLGLGLLEI